MEEEQRYSYLLTPEVLFTIVDEPSNSNYGTHSSRASQQEQYYSSVVSQASSGQPTPPPSKRQRVASKSYTHVQYTSSSLHNDTGTFTQTHAHTKEKSPSSTTTTTTTTRATTMNGTVSKSKLRRFMNVSSYPRISVETRVQSILAILAAQGFSRGSELSADSIRRANQLEQYVFLASDEQYMQKLQLCLNYLRQECGSVIELLCRRPSIQDLQACLQQQSINAKHVFQRWKEECNILEQEITQEMLVGAEHVDSLDNADTKCRRCHSRRISTETKQMRKADEGATTIFRCLNCQSMWRKNA